MKNAIKTILKVLFLPLMLLINPWTIGLYHRLKMYFYSCMVSLYLGCHINAVCCKDFPRFNDKKCITLQGKCIFGVRNKIECFREFGGQKYTPELIIGNGVSFGDDCHVGCINRIKIGNDTLIGSHVMLIDHSHGDTFLNHTTPFLMQPLSSKGEIVIGDNCWIGENAVILPGVTIGADCIIGAGAVVTKSFNEPGLILAGNPARIVRRREESNRKSTDTL